jgi:hypothetical protein
MVFDPDPAPNPALFFRGLHDVHKKFKILTKEVIKP